MSGILLIVRRSLRQHALSSLITILSVALACGLVMSVFCVRQQAHDAFTGGAISPDVAVLGARGSQLQLVLNTIFHLETSPGNISWRAYQDAKKQKEVTLAIPFAVGDNLRGFRIVGTTAEMFTDFEYQEGKKLTPESGRVFKENLREGMLGSYVAQKLGLHINDTFYPFHGLNYDDQLEKGADAAREKMKNQGAAALTSKEQEDIQRSALHDQQKYTVCAILAPTNTPNDHVIWIPIDGMYRMEGHFGRKRTDLAPDKQNGLVDTKVTEAQPQPGEEIPEEYKEVSAVLLRVKSEMSGRTLAQKVNLQSKDLTMVYPIAPVMFELFNKIGWIDKILELVAYLVVLVSAASILASIYNTMNERRREFAILRALGARRATVFGAIIAEAGTIAALGSLCGYLVHAIILGGAAYVIRKNTGVVLDLFEWNTILVLAPLGMTVLGALSGIVPAWKAYGTDVASNLVPAS
jgi:putative ABC transport system permease protein